MKLSIVIVNYNVKYFLEQCLRSVYKALPQVEAEIWVVDNNSSDDSVGLVREKFPEVKLIANKHNPGFARANNQAIRQAQGEYILLLNPDTVVQENTFEASLDFMDRHPGAGGLGIKMLDGRGKYLPESKRGLPTPWVAFCKMTGLTRLFPHSERYARYYLGHLSPEQNQKVEILAGAYMLLRREALDHTGLLDEDYFMYGEDIDLSYRLLQAGYQNYYLAESSIIHYKGESTRKGSLNYVKIFYRAMVIFAQKHFSKRYAHFFGLFIELAIYLRASLSLFSRLLHRLAMPVFDGFVLLAGLVYITYYWENNHRFIQGGQYDREMLAIAFPLLIAIWLLASFLSGTYDPRPRISQVFRGIFWGTIVIFIVYSLLPEHYRFSRAILVLGSLWAALALPSWRYLAQKLGLGYFLAPGQMRKRRLIVGEIPEIKRVKRLIQESGQEIGFTGMVSPSPQAKNENYLGSISDLPEMVRIFEVQEVIFCSHDLDAERIFAEMQELPEVEIKIAPPESQFIIGSNSIHSQGGWYALEFNAINRPSHRRAKRILDFSLGILVLLLGPLLMWFQRQPLRFWGNALACISGRKTWVGYDPAGLTPVLPSLPPAIIPISKEADQQALQPGMRKQLNQLYAQDYSSQTDLQMILLSWRQLGNG